MNEIQRVSRGDLATSDQNACVKDVHERYYALGTAGLLLVQTCVTWADKIGESVFLELARKSKLPFGKHRARKILTVGHRKDVLLAAKKGNLQDRYSVMYEAALIPKEDFAHAVKNKLISKDSRVGDIRSVRDKSKGKVHEGSYSATEAQSISEKTGNTVIDRAGKLHTGVNRQEAQGLQEKLDQAMELARAIELLATMAVEPETLISELRQFDYFPDKYLQSKMIAKAIKWLSQLKEMRDGTE